MRGAIVDRSVIRCRDTEALDRGAIHDYDYGYGYDNLALSS